MAEVAHCGTRSPGLCHVAPALAFTAPNPWFAKRSFAVSRTSTLSTRPDVPKSAPEPPRTDGAVQLWRLTELREMKNLYGTADIP